MDIYDSAKRSRIMAAVKGKDTKPELLVRKYLWSHGVRYRVHSRYLPGKPDIAVLSRKTAIFVNGCLWHGHEGCSRSKLPKSRTDYWKTKVDRNKSRDHLIGQELEKAGWRTLVVWECQLRTQKAALNTLPTILDSLNRNNAHLGLED